MCVHTCMYVCVLRVCMYVNHDNTQVFLRSHDIKKKCYNVSDSSSIWNVIGIFSCQKYFCKRKHLLGVRKLDLRKVTWDTPTSTTSSNAHVGLDLTYDISMHRKLTCGRH